MNINEELQKYNTKKICGNNKLQKKLANKDIFKRG